MKYIIIPLYKIVATILAAWYILCITTVFIVFYTLWHFNFPKNSQIWKLLEYDIDNIQIIDVGDDWSLENMGKTYPTMIHALWKINGKPIK